MKLRNLQEAQYAGQRSIGNLLRFFNSDPDIEGEIANHGISVDGYTLKDEYTAIYYSHEEMVLHNMKSIGIGKDEDEGMLVINVTDQVTNKEEFKKFMKSVEIYRKPANPKRVF